MFTGRMRMRDPGILAPSDSETPSLGCMVRMSWLACTPTEPLDWNARCGTGLSCTAISVTLRASRLPVRNTIGTPAQRREGLGSRVVGDVVLLEVALDVLTARDTRRVLGAHRALGDLLRRGRRD